MLWWSRQDRISGHKAWSAFARHPEKLTLERADLTRVTGDLHSQESIAKAVPGHDAVVITASSTSLRGFETTPRTSRKAPPKP